MWLQFDAKTLAICLTIWLSLTNPITMADSYDFVIVGGGTAGCVLARRLSDNKAFSVLLIEQGERAPQALSVPSNASKHSFGSGERYTFSIHSVPQKHAGLATDGVMQIRTAKILGGGSSLNSMRFNRGSPEAFDTWARVSGDESWNYSNMLKYFKRIENYKGKFPSGQHGSGGPITISSQSYALGISNWLEAGKELGYPVTDPNRPERVSFTPIEYSMKRGRRISAYTGYVRPIEAERNNLKIVTEARVRRVLLEGPRATGVIYTNKDGANFTVSASKEVILSAGVFGSDKLLLLSGIGPEDILTEADIPIVKELPVGKNLQGSPYLTMQFVIKNSSYVLDTSRDLNSDNWKLYEESGRGPYSTVFGYTGQAFLASPGAGKWPDIELVYRPANIPMEPWKDVELQEGEAIVLLWMALTLPRSERGSMGLNSDNPEATPVVDWNYLEDARDVNALLWAINETFRVTESKAFEELGPRYLQEPLPSCKMEEFRSESYWRCYIRQLSQAGLNPSGTCSMGRVVDAELKVKGLEGLRVVDASVIPLQANINLMAEVYAVAEKVADMILTEWMNIDDQAGAFQCPTESGYFPHPHNCSMFFQCSHWVAHKMVCPDGLYFNKDANPGPVCDWPQNVACSMPRITSTEK